MKEAKCIHQEIKNMLNFLNDSFLGFSSSLQHFV